MADARCRGRPARDRGVAGPSFGHWLRGGAGAETVAAQPGAAYAQDAARRGVNLVRLRLVQERGGELRYVCGASSGAHGGEPAARAAARSSACLTPVAAGRGWSSSARSTQGPPSPISWTPGGPVLFVSPRAGLEGRPFGMLKSARWCPTRSPSAASRGLPRTPPGSSRTTPDTNAVAGRDEQGSTSCRARERDSAGRSASSAARGPGRAGGGLTTASSGAGRSGRASPAGPGERPRLVPGRSGSARSLVPRQLVTPARRDDPRAHGRRALPAEPDRSRSGSTSSGRRSALRAHAGSPRSPGRLGRPPRRLGRADVYYLTDSPSRARGSRAGHAGVPRPRGRRGRRRRPAPRPRGAPSGVRDAITPYGYGGPAATGPAPPVERFWELYQASSSERRPTTVIRFHCSSPTSATPGRA